MGSYRDLIAFRKAYDLAMMIFNVSRNFPKEEKYSLTDQIRRSSRSVCTNMAEAYQRRIYRDYFVSKLNDAQAENAETQVWLDFAKDCTYITFDDYESLTGQNTEVGKLIFYMINNPEKFAPKGTSS